MYIFNQCRPQKNKALFYILFFSHETVKPVPGGRSSQIYTDLSLLKILFSINEDLFIDIKWVL
jgi:hypothetical protein